MTVESPFHDTHGLFTVVGEIAGPRGASFLRLVLDTGSVESLVVPEIIETIGYHARDAGRITGVYSALGKEQGYMLRVERFSVLGFSFSNSPIHVFDLPDRYDIDGLIGLSFLRQFNITIRPAEGRILLEKLSS